MLFRRPPVAFNADTAIRQQRERLFQLALFVCLMMVMLDSRTSQIHLAVPDLDDPKEPLQDLKDALNTQHGDGNTYATNITGRYHGNWTKNAYSGKSNSSLGSSEVAAPHFKITSDSGKFAMQVFMEPLEGLSDLSLVKGYFQITGESEPLRHQLTSSVQGVFFHKYGRVLLVTSQEHLYLKGTRMKSPDNRGQPTNLNVTEEWKRRLLEDGPAKQERKLAAPHIFRFPHGHGQHVRQDAEMLEAIIDELGDRRLAGAKGSEGTEGLSGTVGDNNNGEANSGDPLHTTSSVDNSNTTAKLGLTFHPPTSADPTSFFFPFPGPAVPPSTSTAPRCLFLFNLKAGPSCNSEECRRKKDQPHWVMDLDGKIFSENCEVDLSISSHAFRIDWERAYPKAAKYSLLATLVCLVQIVCLFRQLNFTETPAAAARVSLLCIGWQAVLDAIVCVVHLLLCAFLPQLFTAFASVAFFKLIIFIVVEMRYIVVISHSRDPQRFFQGGINQLRQEWALIHLRFYAVLFMSLVMLFFFQNFVDVLVFLAYSYWVPQIVTNCIREVRTPFHRDYLTGVSLTRLVIPLYLYGCPENLATFISGEHPKEPNVAMCLALIAWTGVQVGVLMLQEKLGPHFMIPARFLPEKYQYSRPLPRSILEQAEPEAGGEVECVICYMGIEVRGQRNSYMLTPCDHLFHPACLERWMEQKLECPVCRSVLPPLPP